MVLTSIFFWKLYRFSIRGSIALFKGEIVLHESGLVDIYQNQGLTLDANSRLGWWGIWLVLRDENNSQPHNLTLVKKQTK